MNSYYLTSLIQLTKLQYYEIFFQPQLRWDHRGDHIDDPDFTPHSLSIIRYSSAS